MNNHRMKHPRYALYGATTATAIVVWSFFAERSIFLLDQIKEPNQITLYWVCKILLVLVVFLLAYAGFDVIERYKHDCDYAQEVRWCGGLFLGLFAVLLAILICTWPGVYNTDSFFILGRALQLKPSLFSQGTATGLFHIVVLMVFPFPAAVLLVQDILIAALMVHCGQMAYRILCSRWAYLVILPVLLPPFLFYSAYPLRAILISVTMVWLLMYLLYHFFAKTQTPTWKEAAVAGAVTALLANWRFEFRPIIVAVPIMLMALRSKIGKKTFASLVSATVICFLIISRVQRLNPNTSNKLMGDLRVILVSPLSCMLQEELEGPRVQQDLEVLSQVFDLKVLRENPDALSDAVRYQKPEVNVYGDVSAMDVILAWGDLIVHNPKAFLRTRIENFAHTDRAEFNYWFTLNPELLPPSNVPEWADMDENRGMQLWNQYFGHPMAELRAHVLQWLTSPSVFWRQSLAIALTVIVLLYSLCGLRQSLNRGLCFASLGSLYYATATFLTIPIIWNMYWLPVLLTSWTMAVFCLCDAVLRIGHRQLHVKK